MAQVVCPGDRLGRVSEFASGPGTYIRGAHVFASVVGPVLQQPGDDSTAGLPMLMVTGRRRAQDQVIEVGDVVMGRVTRMRAAQAFVEILCAGDTVLRETYQGVIRKEVSMFVWCTVSQGSHF
jgi:exosome complex RNA-binding protein Csl4